MKTEYCDPSNSCSESADRKNLRTSAEAPAAAARSKVGSTTLKTSFVVVV